MAIGTQIKKRREELGLTQEELAKRIGYRSKSTIKKIELGINDIPQKKIVDFANALETSVAELMEWNDKSQSKKTFAVDFPYESLKIIAEKGREEFKSKYSNVSDDEIIEYLINHTAVRIPVLGRVAAGIPISAVEEIIDWEEITPEMASDGEYFALRIKGDSMEPRIRDGDVVVVRQQDTADDGQLVIAIVNGDDAVCKKLRKYPNGMISLVSTNPAYEPLVFTVNEIDQMPVRVIGVVKELRAKF